MSGRHEARKEETTPRRLRIRKHVLDTLRGVTLLDLWCFILFVDIEIKKEMLEEGEIFDPDTFLEQMGFEVKE